MLCASSVWRSSVATSARSARSSARALPSSMHAPLCLRAEHTQTATRYSDPGLAENVENQVASPISERKSPSGLTEPEEAAMKYMVIIYGNKDLWQSFPPDVIAEAIGQVDAFNKRYAETSELLGAYGLGDELTAKTVRVRDGIPAITDGPYLEAKEFVSS